MGLANDQADRAATKETPSARYYKGPAFGTKLAGDLQKNTWSTYRSDSHRSGSTEMPGPAKLKTLWARKLSDVNSASMQAEWDHKDGGRLTTTVVSGGMVFAAVSDTHELSALDADSGEPRWSFVAGGRIDCPPTIYQGLCLFGSRDGWVYCLQASDGKLVWRFRAAPDPRRIVAYGQLESPWPVVGGVLIHDGLAFFAVGRHAGADGGVHVYAAEPTTGKILWHSNPEGYRTLPDLLVASGEEVHMADWQFNAKTGKDQSSTSREYLRSSRLGLLNDAWYKRPLALRKNLQQWSTDQASGQLMTFNKAWVCAFRGVSSVSGSDGRISGNAELIAKPLTGNGRGWSIKLPIGTQIKGMVLAGQTLFIAGRLNGYDEKSNGVRALAIADGKQVAEIQLPSPLVHDCLSVAGKRVYVSTHGGQIICLGDQ